MQCIAVVLASAMALAAGSEVNYCGSRMCGNTNAHTFCQFPEGPGPNCVGYISAPLTLEEKSRVIARLNRRRNEAAAGKMRGFPTAGDMLKLNRDQSEYIAGKLSFKGEEPSKLKPVHQWLYILEDKKVWFIPHLGGCTFTTKQGFKRWVEELAREARRWAEQCRPPRTIEEHDACRNLYALSVGQCVASVVGEAPGLRVESMVDIWYMQSMAYKGNVTYYVPPSRNGSFYGDFAQIMWAQTYMVGCGRSRFMIPWQGRLRSVERLVCNFAPQGPPPARSLWTPTSPAASCPSRSQRDPVLHALCDYQRDPREITVVDFSMSLEDHLLLDTVLEIENNETLNYLGSLDEIYLTKLAIATMANTISTQVYFNSMQRRDVVEVIDSIESQQNISTINANTFPYEVIPTPFATIEAMTVKVSKTPKKKTSLIGRPRAYNVDDLTDSNEKSENVTPIEAIPKRERDFYAEYGFVDPIEDNATSVPIDTINNSEVPGEVNILINQDVLRDVVTRLYQNSSMLYGGPVHTFVDNALAQSGVLNLNDSVDAVLTSGTQEFGNVSVTDNINVDDYLSDPETVRELQEALDRIEHEMASKAGKVRRELRDRKEVKLTTEEKALKNAIYNAEVERNKTLERGPMYNMVLRYMPYLKQYEKELMPRSADASGSITSRSSLIMFVLVFIVCL